MKTIVIIVVAILFVGIGVFVFTDVFNEDDSASETAAETSQSTEGQSSDEADPEAQDVEYTREEVALHNTEDDCWTIIDGGVYDITDYVARHPGGDEILRACGADGSSLFNSRTTEDGETVGSGTSHSSSAQSLLADMEIGVVEGEQ